MKTRTKAILGMLLLAGLLASGCATQGATGSATASGAARDPFYSPSWWGMDPVCSPGCPPAMSPGW
ncbi:MAG: hypothetical protein WAU47_16060 [Desulfobaccales bacterium]